MVYESRKSRLGKEEKENYERMLYALRAFRQDFPILPCSPEKLLSLYGDLVSDHPELFYVSPSYSYEQGPDSMSLHFSYLYGKEEAMRMSKEMEALAQSFSMSSKRESVDAFLSWIIRECRYEIDDENNQNASSVLLAKVAQCSGFAKSLKYVCDHQKIMSFIINGELHNEEGEWAPHAWNLVYLDGKYHHVDPTCILASNPGGNFANEAFHFWNDYQMRKTHRWKEEEYPPSLFALDPDTHMPVKIDEDSLPSFSSPDELEKWLKKEYRKGQREYLFNLEGEEGDEEKMKLIQSALKRFMNACRISGNASTQYGGNSFKITLSEENSPFSGMASLFKKIFGR